MCESRHTLELPFLRSCKKEIASPVTGEITGQIPEWLQGSLIRIGSGLLEVGEDQFAHIFDGLALMHRFSIQNGNITYQNRFLRSDTYRKNTEANRIVVAEFGTTAPDPCKSIFERISSFFSMKDFSDNDLVNIVKYTDDYYACSETNFIWKIDPETLESQKKVDLSKHVPIMTGTAHPHESIDGTVYNVGNYFGYKAQYVIIKFPSKDKDQSTAFDNGSVVCKIPSSRCFSPSYFHSFAMTENYFIFVEQPLILALHKMLLIPFTSKSYADCMEWHPEWQTQFHIICRETGKILDTKYFSKAFMVFHHINAYEDEHHLVVDACCYENGEIVKALYVEALKSLADNPENQKNYIKAEPRRYVLPLKLDQEQDKNLIHLKNSKAKAFYQKNGTVLCDPELLSEEGYSMELPRINYEEYNGRKYRYFYAISQRPEQPLKHGTSLVKVDIEEGTSLHWKEENVIPSEPVFIADPKSENKSEDTGILLASLLYKDNECKVSLLILDATTMKELGRATFKVESSVPGDFHGVFVPKPM